MKRFLFLMLLGVFAFTLSSCEKQEVASYEIRVVNETDKKCNVNWLIRQDHDLDGGWTNTRPLLLNAHSTECITRCDPCPPSKLFARFTITTTDGEVVYDASPVVDADWKLEQVRFLYSKKTETVYVYTFTIR